MAPYSGMLARRVGMEHMASGVLFGAYKGVEHGSVYTRSNCMALDVQHITAPAIKNVFVGL